VTRKTRLRALATLTALAAGVPAAWAATSAAAAGATATVRGVASSGTCSLGPGGKIKHVIYIQFDNTHYTRDNPNVPSDLQQMPNLLNFITSNGTLITHEHTPLISHTANDIVTSESGLYGNHHGMPIANTYQYYKPDGTTDTAGSFAYWTDPIVDYNTGKPVGDHTPTMIGAMYHHSTLRRSRICRSSRSSSTGPPSSARVRVDRWPRCARLWSAVSWANSPSCST